MSSCFARESVVDVDPVGGDAQLCESFVLDGEVQFVGGASGVSDAKRRHGAPPVLCRPESDIAPGTGSGEKPLPTVHRRQVIERST